MCRWFQILDPQNLRERLTPKLRLAWMRYYERNACHPLSVPMTIAIGNHMKAKSMNKKNVQGKDPGSFMYPPVSKNTTSAISAKDPDAVLGALAGFMK